MNVPRVPSSVCGVAQGGFSKSDFAKPPTVVCGERAFLEYLPRRKGLAIKRAVLSPQIARKRESKVVLKKHCFALPGWSSNFGTARLHGLLLRIVVYNPRDLHVREGICYIWSMRCLLSCSSDLDSWTAARKIRKASGN